ncbi:type I-F CRISPR-associated protein Csy2 [Oceanimonas smirnovii]|uniref:type I-F CRISPR-associated protein Csy2 n=1 Tax=Oceanimonas smirnovii TaxID=264574 RepID=UPI00377022EA
MSQYLVLSCVKIQNANSIAGFTWGFPAITQFLGFTHALNRKLSDSYGGDYPCELTGCMVIANKADNKVYKPKGFADVEFLQSKNPPVLAKHKSNTPPIIEEGKVNLTVSLVLELDKPLSLTLDKINKLEHYIESLCRSMRIAGGSVLDIAKVKLLSASTEEQDNVMLKKIQRLCMPGFVLKDQSDYLAQRVESIFTSVSEERPQPILSAWLDFSALKSVAEPKLKEQQTEPDEQTDASWDYEKRKGYLVPIMVGYKAISDIYDAGQVECTRDPNIPSRFVEAIHSIGEWLSMHRVHRIEEFIWRYYQHDEWYLCQQTSRKTDEESLSVIESNQSQFDIDEEIINLF